jgi:sRNA-binding protein
MAAAYCRAVLSHDHRIALDGTPAEAVDAAAKDLAIKRLAQIAERKAAKKAAKPKSPPPAPPPEPPKPLRDRVRASLLRRRA